MKKIILLITVIVLNLNNCTTNRKIIKQYRIAYDYFLQLPNIKKNGLKLSDTIVFLELTNFYQELSEGNDKCLLFILDSLDKERHFENYIFPKLHDLPSNQLSRYNLFFSEFIDNLLLAEILEDNTILRSSYNHLAAFNQGQLYLFVFDNKKRNIKKIYTKNIHYD